MLETLRNCPRCHDVMQKVELGTVIIDRCAACGGEFYDAGEVEATTSAPCDPKELAAHFESAAGDEHPSPLACSACGMRMRARMVIWMEICFELDACPRCKGIWLDHDEPRKLREVLFGMAEGERQGGLFQVLWQFRCF